MSHSQQDRVRLAIVGCGTISQLNAPGYLKHEACDVVALCDPVRERAEGRAAEWGIAPRIYTCYEQVLEDPDIDAVELLTPTHLHAEQSIAALEAGKHVSCQKPVAATVEEADRIAEAAARADTFFRVTENFLYYPPLVKAKELLDGGAVGKPSIVRMRVVLTDFESDSDTFRIERDALSWRRDAELNPGGLLYDEGVHKYATAMWLVGEPEAVSAMVTRTDDFMIEAPSVITWKFRDANCLGVFESAAAPDMNIRAPYYPLDDFFEIQGSAGTIWVTRCSGEMLDLPPVMLHKGSESVSYQVPMDWLEGFDGAARDFVDGILEGRQPMMDADFAKKVLQAALAAYRSSDTQRPVDPSAIA